MHKKINILVLALLSIPLLGLFVFYGVNGQPFISSSLTTQPPTQRIIKGDKAISMLKGVHLKVPLFEKAKIPLIEGDMNFLLEGKLYKVAQTYPSITATGIILFPIQISEGTKQTYNVITAFIKRNGEYEQKQSVFLGNKIQINAMHFSKNILSVNYDTPGKGKTEVDETAINQDKYFQLYQGKFSPYYPNINNGAIQDLSIIQYPWIWKETSDAKGTKIVPKNLGKFTLIMNEEGDFKATTDCNTAIGKFTMDMTHVQYSKVEISNLNCSDSTQQNLFLSSLKDTKTYEFKTQKFILDLPNGSKVIFEKN